jgi:hypothetical protein
MKRLQGFVRWLLIAFGFGVIGLFAAHLALRPNPKIAASEQYNVLSAYIEPNLTGESHDLGSSNGLVVIDGRTTFSRPLANSNKFKQYVSLLASTGRAKAKIHSWVVPSCLSFGRLTCAARPWTEDFSCLHATK